MGGFRGILAHEVDGLGALPVTLVHGSPVSIGSLGSLPIWLGCAYAEYNLARTPYSARYHSGRPPRLRLRLRLEP